MGVERFCGMMMATNMCVSDHRKRRLLMLRATIADGGLAARLGELAGRCERSSEEVWRTLPDVQCCAGSCPCGLGDTQMGLYDVVDTSYDH